MEIGLDFGVNVNNTPASPRDPDKTDMKPSIDTADSNALIRLKRIRPSGAES